MLDVIEFYEFFLFFKFYSVCINMENLNGKKVL